MPDCHSRWQHGTKIWRLVAITVVLHVTHIAGQGIVSEAIAPVARDTAEDLLPVSEAAFEQLRADNAALRASNAALKASNSKSLAVLDAAEAKLTEVFPGSPGLDGTNGSEGPAGVLGEVGQAGSTGGTGISGVAGGFGQSGLAGSSGLRGSGGATGQSGLKGDTGASGGLGTYGNTGNKGPTGLLGLSGMSGLRSTGSTGMTNMQGTQGDKAVTGSFGNTGTLGGLGTTASLGETGTIGGSGNTGFSGTSGISGADGNTGMTGATFCNVGYCIGANGACVSTDGSTCAPTSNNVNQPCPTSSTFCSTLTTLEASQSGLYNAAINSVCDGQGQCNPTQGFQGFTCQLGAAPAYPNCPIDGSVPDLDCKTDPTPGLSVNGIAIVRGRFVGGACTSDAECALRPGAGVNFACVTDANQGTNSCTQVAPLYCLTHLDINNDGATLCITRDNPGRSSPGTCPNGYQLQITFCDPAADPNTALAIASLGFNGVLLDDNSCYINEPCTRDSDCRQGYFCDGNHATNTNICCQYGLC